ncbi:C-type lectin-like [Eriocheir sinensis]|uniref:C-type lectin-like n=1 Tax=Eriocheir sinensis TaxID=95602 RepID=UPI0021C7C13F|nr:C-type lectin-like [Eriocheir sinensis]XP_050713122.1 C-type lectin-like [Eriocheir sinensis]XP_050713123.1 C-type lectin-like [Eriocheir sinensis]XP_050713124.1 C-type lectin-like [Eriocheir sinensis]XP_050713125.1 C-type lectin-like [Eriocheir sinensis]
MPTTMASLALLAALLPVVFVSGENASCPADWTLLQDMCLWISDEELPYWRAYEECKNNGSHLTYIESAQEDFLLAGALSVKGKESVWIGLNDLEIDNVFVWVDNEPLTYSNFHEGDPAVTGPHAEENCVAMTSAKNYQWSSEYCFDHRAFVCRKDLQ